MNWRDGSLAAQWLPVCRSAEIKYGIPTYLLARQCYEESRFNPLAMSPSGAIGIMQLLPQYFPDAGRDAAADIATGAGYLKSLYKRFDDWQLALAAYDWGPAAVARWQKSGGTFDKLPLETQDYVTQIISDVPVEGVICRTQNPQQAGSPLPQPSQGQDLGLPPHRSLWQSATSILSHPSAPNSVQPSPASASSSQAISSPTAGESKGVSVMSNLDTALSMLKNNLEVDLIPVLIGALQVYQKSPDTAGLAAAEAYLLGNAPAALLVEKTTLLQQVINDLNTELAKLKPPPA